jgi:hypothetical protein
MHCVSGNILTSWSICRRHAAALKQQTRCKNSGYSHSIPHGIGTNYIVNAIFDDNDSVAHLEQRTGKSLLEDN